MRALTFYFLSQCPQTTQWNWECTFVKISNRDFLMKFHQPVMPIARYISDIAWVSLLARSLNAESTNIPHTQQTSRVAANPCIEEELGFFLVMTQNSVVPSLFLVGGTPLSLNWLWTQFKKVQWWVEQQFKFSFWPMNWTWIDHQVQGKNWIELRTSIQFWTAIQLWIFIQRKILRCNPGMQSLRMVNTRLHNIWGCVQKTMLVEEFCTS